MLSVNELMSNFGIIPSVSMVIIPTPHQSYKRYGIGGINYHTGATAILPTKTRRNPET
jgi:hypothetical protein